MTALNFLVQEDQICFAIDTLSISADDRLPSGYLTKFIFLPHLSTVVTGTGHGTFINEWMNFVRGKIIAKDIDHLNEYVPQALNEIAEQFPELGDITATVYHFGFSIRRNIYTGYAYRSVNEWRSEELKPGTGLKPPIDVDLNKNYKLPEKFRRSRIISAI